MAKAKTDFARVAAIAKWAVENGREFTPTGDAYKALSAEYDKAHPEAKAEGKSRIRQKVSLAVLARIDSEEALLAFFRARGGKIEVVYDVAPHVENLGTVRSTISTMMGVQALSEGLVETRACQVEDLGEEYGLNLTSKSDPDPNRVSK